MRSQIAVLDHDGEVEAIERQRHDAHGDPVEPHQAWARELRLAKSSPGLNLAMVLPQNALAVAGEVLHRGGGLRGHLRYFGHSYGQVMASDFATSLGRQSSSCISLLFILVFLFQSELHQHLLAAIGLCNSLFLLI